MQGLAAPPVGADLDMVSKLLQFHATQGKQSDLEMQLLAEQISEVQTEIQALTATMGEISMRQSAAGRMITSRDITIALSVPKKPTRALTLQLTYIVQGASWAPTYDIRATIGADKSGGESSDSMQVTYFGVVKQSTGEDWDSVSVTLSTASPAVAGTPPLPPTRIARFARNQRAPMPRRRRDSRRLNTLESRAGMVRVQAEARELVRQTSIHAMEATME
jgi:uncharacterized protein (TIGR02231 family)